MWIEKGLVIRKETVMGLVRDELNELGVFFSPGGMVCR